MHTTKNTVKLTVLSKAISKFISKRKKSEYDRVTLVEYKTSGRTPECKLKRRLSMRFSTQRKVAYNCETTIAVMGDTKVGKTKMLQSLAEQPVSGNARKLSYRPTLTEKYSKSVALKSKNRIVCKHQVKLVDTSGKTRSFYRPLFIDTVKECEAFIVMFSLENEASLLEAEEIIGEIDSLKRNNNTPILLIAMKNEETSAKETDHKTLIRISKINRGLYFMKTMSESECYMDSLVCLLTEIERRNGIDRGCNEVTVL